MSEGPSRSERAAGRAEPEPAPGQVCPRSRNERDRCPRHLAPLAAVSGSVTGPSAALVLDSRLGSGPGVCSSGDRSLESLQTVRICQRRRARALLVAFPLEGASSEVGQRFRYRLTWAPRWPEAAGSLHDPGLRRDRGGRPGPISVPRNDAARRGIAHGCGTTRARRDVRSSPQTGNPRLVPERRKGVSVQSPCQATQTPPGRRPPRRCIQPLGFTQQQFRLVGNHVSLCFQFDWTV